MSNTRLEHTPPDEDVREEEYFDRYTGQRPVLTSYYLRTRSASDDGVDPSWTYDIRDDPFSDDPLERELCPLDYAPSSTATNPTDAKRDMETDYAVGRFAYTQNATYTDEDLPAHSELATTLNQINRETTDDDSHVESARRKTDRRNDVRSWGRRIGLTDTEITEAIHIVEGVPSGSLRNFGVETVILGALSIAANMKLGGNHTVRSIRLRGAPVGNNAPVERYESLRQNLSVSQQSVSDFRRWYNQNHL